MHTTGSRTLLGMRPIALRVMLLAFVAALGVGLMFAYTSTTSAGGDAKVTVNSTGNFDDGDCEGPPN